MKNRIEAFIRECYNGDNNFTVASKLITSFLLLTSIFFAVTSVVNATADTFMLNVSGIVISASLVIVASLEGFSNLWNPFRFSLILSLYLILISVLISSDALFIFGLCCVSLSILGWNEFVQKPSDKHIENLVNDKKRELEALQAELNKAK
jgi:hypothetical protein